MKVTSTIAAIVGFVVIFLVGQWQYTAAPDGETVAATDGIPLGPLPRDVVPRHYTMALTVVPEEKGFEGHEVIEVTVTRATDKMFFHGKGLSVSKVEARGAGGETIAAIYREVDPSGVARLDFARPLPVGAATLDITWSADFNPRLEGLYKVEEGGEAYAFTQMQAISARVAFPGFDEPAFKTPFDITITAKADAVVIGNTPIAEETALPGGMKEVRLATTKPMPTELLAWAVGNLDVVEWKPMAPTALRDHAVPLRGITAHGKGEKIRYALENTEAIVNTLEDYFGIGYPFAKLDIIAVPDFAAGAMENIGAITYREQLMLFEKKASLGQKRGYVTTNAHELAHQWFGDLVTPKWWSDIWLNESFATWMAYRAANTWKPDQQYDRSFRRSILGIMQLDSLPSTRQVRQPVADNNDIANAFDGITYQKGGGVIAMIEKYMGDAAFQKGVHHHLSRFSFGTATSSDFMESLAQSSGNDKVVAAFSSFIDQPGLPLVSAELSCKDDGAPTVRLEQSRYFQLGAGVKNDQSWKIPLCLAYTVDGERHEQCSLMEERQATVALDGGACPSSLLPNADGAGYYRFRLDADGWNALLADLPAYSAPEALSIADSFEASVRAGKTGADVYLGALSNFGRSAYWDVSTAPLGMLAFIDNYLVPEGHQGDIRALFAELYAGQYAALGLDADTDADRSDPSGTALLRTRIVNFLAFRARLPELRTVLAKQGAAYIGFEGDGVLHTDAIIPELVGVALGVAAQEKGAPFFDALEAIIDSSKDAILRQRAIGAIAGIEDPELAARARGLMLSPKLRDNEAVNILFRQSASKQLRAGLWQWVRDNFEPLIDRIPTWSRGRLPFIASGFCSAERRAEVKNFFAPRIASLEGGKRGFAQSLERIDQCIALKKAQAPAVAAFFEARK